MFCDELRLIPNFYQLAMLGFAARQCTKYSMMKVTQAHVTVIRAIKSTGFDLHFVVSNKI